MAVGYILYEIDRRQRRLHEIWDVLGARDEGRGSDCHAGKHGRERRVAAIHRGAAAMTAAQTPARELSIASPRSTDQRTVLRLDTLTTDVGWLLITAGVIGVIVPGVPGTPFLIVGVLVITPGGTNLLARWSGKKPPRFINGGLKQIGRFLDDLERRYPRASKRPG
ncbi:MAG: hypothetical protein ABSC06_19245 [Rhodopila sp.]